MDRRKTTLYLDVDVLTAVKVLAATGGRSESQVVEDALRAHLRAGQLEWARSELQDLMDRIQASDDRPGDEEALNVAVAETRAARRSRHRSA